MSDNALLAKLAAFAELTENERSLLATLSRRDLRKFTPKQHIIREGDRPEHVHLILEGWAMRYKVVDNGARQIVAFLLPGDFCDLHVAVLGHMDHGIAAITPCQVAFIPNATMNELTSNHNSLTKSLWWGTLVDEAMLRNWVVNIGRRDALQRIAHLFCELHLRMEMVGLVHGDRFSLPLTQEELADATGLTPVHTNRTLQRLRADGLIELGSRVLTLLDLNGLRKAAGFDPSYLHLARRANGSSAA